MEGILGTNASFEQQMGIGLTPAQVLWEMSSDQVRVLEEGKQQINAYVEEKIY